MEFKNSSSIAKVFITVFTVLSFSAHSKTYLSPDKTKIIYGEDNRSDVANYPDALFRDHAQSVAGMVFGSSLSPIPNNPDEYQFAKIPAMHSIGVCPEERFAQQYTLPYCSGFLVGDDLLVTAGHCVEDIGSCKRFKWVFGLTSDVQTLAKNDVYGCKEIIAQKLHTSYAKVKDYALIRLDRKVDDRAALEYRKEGKARINDPLVVIGHPFALPLKIADGSNVSRMNLGEILRPIRTLFRKRYYFIANLDTFSGNSGSPVFNKETGLVEGILIEGGEDFYEDETRGCKLSNRVSDSRWITQEKVFRITKIPELQND